MRSAANIKRCSVFTLVELVLALGIFTLIALTVVMALHTVISTREKVSSANAELDEYRVIDQIVNTAFRNAVPFQWTDNNNKNCFVFKGDSDSLLITYLHRSESIKEGGLRFLKLELRDEKLLAIYRKSPILPNDEISPEDSYCKTEVLAENVRSISFLYAWYENDKLTWSESWNDEDMKYIPSAIQMTITWNDGRSERWLRRTAGMGKYKSFGNRLY